MKSKKSILAVLLTMVISTSVLAGNIVIVEKNGQKKETNVELRDVKNKGVKTGSEAMTYFENISSVSTANFELHERLLKKTERRYKHVKINYTGSKNLHSLRLEKLNRKKKGSDVTRAAGSIMTIIGILSGDRNLTAAGVATNVVGHVAKDNNQRKTNNVHTEMLNDLDRRTKEVEAENEELKLKQAYGVENVEGLKALVDKKHEKAMALANVGELSENEDFKLSAVYLKALISADMDDESNLEQQLERIVNLDNEVDSYTEAEKEVNILLEEVNKLRVKD